MSVTGNWEASGEWFDTLLFFSLDACADPVSKQVLRLGLICPGFQPLLFYDCKEGTLPSTSMAPDRGSLAQEINPPGTLSPILRSWEEGVPLSATNKI